MCLLFFKVIATQKIISPSLAEAGDSIYPEVANSVGLSLVFPLTHSRNFQKL